ncbi:hypothetical protein PTKIN_Ptkin05aG0094900 [Pterospermum kingtungense]
MGSFDFNFPKLENTPYEFDYLNCEENIFGKDMGLPSFEVESVYDFNYFNFNSPALPCQGSCYTEFSDFEDISHDLALLYQNSTTSVPSLHEDIVVDAKPVRTIVGSIGQFYDNYCANNGGSSEPVSVIKREYGVGSIGQYSCYDDNIHRATNGGSSEVPVPVGMMKREQGRSCCGRKRSAPLELDEIQKYFDFPISKAAKKMKVGLTVLKKRCRELNIMRWPHRKIKSLKSLINNVKELGLTNEIVMLEKHKRLLQEVPDMELTQRTKKLRQACFKANYKKRRSLAALR